MIDKPKAHSRRNSGYDENNTQLTQPFAGERPAGGDYNTINATGAARYQRGAKHIRSNTQLEIKPKFTNAQISRGIGGGRMAKIYDAPKANFDT